MNVRNVLEMFVRRFSFPIMHVICPSVILHNLCLSFLLGITAAVLREIENNAYAKFWGPNKVHCGECGSGVLSCVQPFGDYSLFII